MADPAGAPAASSHRPTWKTSGYPMGIAAESAATNAAGVEKGRAMSRTAIATTNPAIGPAMPMSNSCARERMGERMRMNAPKVPISVGAGIKNGRVAFTP